MSPGYCELTFEQVNKVAMLKWTLHILFSGELSLIGNLLLPGRARAVSAH